MTRKSSATATKATVVAVGEEKSGSGEKANTLKDSTLLSTTGPLAKRLDKLVGHYPVMPDGRRKCAVHRWAANMEVKAHVYKCSFCNLHLCIDCFRTFHAKVDLVGFKDTLRGQMEANKEASAKKKTPPSKASK